MKTYLALLLIACSSSVALAQGNWDKTPYQTKSLANDAIKDVFVNTSGGSISVSGAAGESARIEIYVRGNNNQELSKEEIQKRLDKDYDLQVTVNNHEVHAVAKRKKNFNIDWKRPLSISFKIYVPREVATHLNTSGGSIHLDNLIGAQEFSTSGGSLHMDNLAGRIKGETSGGSIQVNNSKDIIDLETSGGSINAKNCQGKIRLETSGGSLHLEALEGSITANTSGGSIQANNIKGELVTGTSGGSVNLSAMACSLNASTSGGSMHVDMRQLGKYVKLDVSGGHVDLTLPANQGMNLNLSASKIRSSNVSKFTGEWEKDHVKGTLNGGGIPVSVEASDNLNIVFN
ncbi:hypothetical protein MuYL_2969 [Mucilaginibacter xinganensis]|uniref:DUF4097 domain-containing protein n=2 Tax=Mucilaginibacter xinganensis TaxID=1234841 RepID=A0A223NYF0_9SPHI|nr:hypothetical protein MuYL_2969 [Mucilaginibacter xinganensis]